MHGVVCDHGRRLHLGRHRTFRYGWLVGFCNQSPGVWGQSVLCLCESVCVYVPANLCALCPCEPWTCLLEPRSSQAGMTTVLNGIIHKGLQEQIHRQTHTDTTTDWPLQVKAAAYNQLYLNVLPLGGRILLLSAQLRRGRSHNKPSGQ